MGRSKRSRRGLLSVTCGMTAATLALACNGLVGLSDYERAECSGGGVCFDAGFPDSSADVRSDARDATPDVVETIGTPPVSWAQFKMPNYPNDAGLTDNLAKYSPAAGGFHDDVSGLTWQEPIAASGSKTWKDAQTLCPSGWRLPSRIELVTLLDLSKKSGAKIDAIFGSTEPQPYWTSSPVRLADGSLDGRQWTVDFNGGGVSQTSTNLTAGVRCIKSK